jgi:hypothetical protein
MRGKVRAFPTSNREAAFAWAPGVNVVAVDDDLVFLDVNTGSYACLAGAAVDVQTDPEGALAIGDPALATKLAEAGLIEPWRPTDGASRRGRHARRATASAVRWTYPQPQAADIAPIARAALDAAFGYRNAPFAKLIARSKDLPRADGADPALIAAVDRFHRWIPFAPLSGKCLLRAFVLKTYLARRGFGVDWVFGVATWPFSAHCWLQVDGLVLDDTLERVGGYTPILVA